MGGLTKINKQAGHITGVSKTNRVVGKWFGMKSGDTPDPPPVEPVPVMPLPDDEAVMKAKRKSQAGQAARKGRVSTIFTAEGTGLGG